MQFSKQTKRTEQKPTCSPGPGAYEVKIPQSHPGVVSFDKMVIGDRNDPLKCPDGPLPMESPPPRETKQKAATSNANANDRKFSWATEKIHSLSSQLDAASTKLKDHDKVVSDMNRKHQSEISDIKASLDQEISIRKCTVEDLAQTKSAAAHQVAALSHEIETLQQKLIESGEILESERLLHNAEVSRIKSESAAVRSMDQKAVEDLKAEAEKAVTGLRLQLASEVSAMNTEVDNERKAKEGLRLKAEAQASAMQAEIESLVSHLAEKDQELKSTKAKVEAVESQLAEHKMVFVQAEDKAHALSEEIKKLGLIASETAAELRDEKQRSLDSRAAGEQLQAKIAESHSIQSQMRVEGARLVAVEAELRSKLSSCEEKLREALYVAQQRADDSAKYESLLSESKAQLKSIESQQLSSRHKFDSQVQELHAALNKANERVIKAEHAAFAAEAAVFESRRLQEENQVLNVSIGKLQQNLVEINNSLAIGHNNSKQKIQYHLRLKQELEEMRTELTCLLKDRFLLEQCIRYLSAKSGGARASVSASTSLAPSTLFSTPIAQKTMRLGARGKGCDQGTVYADNSKEDIERSIESAKKRTADEVAGAFASPIADESPNSDMTAIHAKIMAKIGQVLAPPPSKSAAIPAPQNDLGAKDQAQRKLNSSINSNADLPSGRRGAVFRS